MTMIENSERGVTINKTLAWGMLLSLVSGVWFGGTTIAKLQAATDSLSSAIIQTQEIATEDRIAAVALSNRVRMLESSSSRQDARFDALKESLEELKTAQRETNGLLRQIVKR